jgi:hypothetical protein
MSGTFALSVLLGLAALLLDGTTRAAPCGACDGDSCQVKDDIRVNKLCASELCVNGTSVVVGDGNPCTSDDTVNGVAVHTPIKDCCSKKADCAQWLPDTCYTSECTKALVDGKEASHGFCVHERIAGCCACAADCPAVPCKTATCRATDAADTIFTKRNAGADVHFDRLHKENSVLSAPGECVYEAVPKEQNCCAKNSDCAEGVCIAGECTPLPETQFECARDVDCQSNVMANEKCAKKGRCHANICDRGFCECKADFDKDADGDGVCCGDDCDDTKKELKTSIWCTLANATDINRDNDTFVKCGAPVEPLCLTACPADRVRVNETQLDTSYVHGTKQQFVRWQCDCCDANPSSLRPDEYVYCCVDGDNDNFCEPVITPLLPGLAPAANTGCVAQTCVLQPAATTSNSTSPTTLPSDAVRTEQCRAHFATLPASLQINVTTVLFVPTEFRDNDACDQCGTDAGQTLADKTCPKSVLHEGRTVLACSADIDDINDCCAQIMQRKDTPGLPAEQKAWEACCENILDSQTASEPPTCEPGDAEYPLIEDQCKCKDGPVLCNARITCDKDWDGYYACGEPKVVCVDEYDADEDESGEEEDKLCHKLLGSTSHWAGYKKTRGEAETGDEDGTFCDCNDKDPSAHGLIACLEDKDGDGVPAAMANPFKCDTRAPKCKDKICAKTCPAGYISIDHKLSSKATEPNCKISPTKKRSVLDAVIAKHVKCGGKPGGCEPYDHDDDNSESSSSSTDNSASVPPEPLIPRDDKSCDAELRCDALDCCDKDDRVYERNNFLPVWSANGPNKCGGLDYDCDCKNETIVACPGAVSAPRGSVVLFATEINNAVGTPLNPFIFTEVLTLAGIPLGGCGASSGMPTTCQANTVKGWLPEVAGARKRALSVDLMSACTKHVAINVATNGSVTVDDVATTAIETEATLKPGYCAEWVEGCQLTGTQCSPDCEICVRLTQ